MSWRAFFTDSANLDLLGARDWYEKERAGLGLEFVGEVESATMRIENEFAEILSVMHAHRDPESWKQRR